MVYSNIKSKLYEILTTNPFFTLKGVIIIAIPMFSDVANGKYSEKNLSEKDILGHEI